MITRFHLIVFNNFVNNAMVIPSIITQESSCSFTKFVGKVESANSSMRSLSFNLSFNGSRSVENDGLGRTQN